MKIYNFFKEVNDFGITKDELWDWLEYGEDQRLNNLALKYNLTNEIIASALTQNYKEPYHESI